MRALGRVAPRFRSAFFGALFLLAAGAAAAPSTLTLTELIRPTAGRPTAAIVSGHLHASIALFPRGVEIADGVVEVTLEAERRDGTNGSDYPYAFEIELPPLPAGAAEVRLKSRAGAEPASFEASTSLVVQPAIAAGIESADEGDYRVWIAGSGAPLRFETLPILAGDTLRVQVSTELCDPSACPPAGTFRSASEPFAAPPAGRYRLEIFAVDASALIFKSEEELLGGEVLVRGGRFAIEVQLDPPHAVTPRLVMPPTADSALFYFFSADNWEAMVKVLDGCAINGHFWVFGAASTDVGYNLVVRDQQGDGVREYRHAAGSPAPALTDIAAFPCD